MKKIILYMIMAIAGMIAVSCDKAIDEFDNSTNYIYFDMPFVLDQYGRKTTVREDSLMYSFAMDDLSVTEYTFKIPVNSVGLVTDQDRGFKVVVESGTATGNDWDETSLSKGMIPAGELIDTLRVTVKRTDVLKKEWRTITFRLEQNEHFALGAAELLKYPSPIFCNPQLGGLPGKDILVNFLVRSMPSGRRSIIWEPIPIWRNTVRIPVNSYTGDKCLITRCPVGTLQHLCLFVS